MQRKLFQKTVLSITSLLQLTLVCRYCASSVSGMGTTLAITGAYQLAGQLLQNKDNFTAAFNEYEEKMRPIVAKAQKIAPAKLKMLFGTETWWGVWILNTVIGLLSWPAPVFKLLFRYLSPPAEQISIEDYGFEDGASKP